MAITIGLIITNSIMFLSVIFSGSGPAALEGFDKYQYVMSFMLAPVSLIWFFIFYTITERKFIFDPNTWAGNPNPYSFRISGLPAIAWSANYVCLLLANPCTPGILQVIFNELNLPIVFILSGLLVRGFRKYTVVEYIAVVIVSIGGLIPLATHVHDTVDCTLTIQSADIWYSIYIIGAITIGISGVFSEFVVKTTKTTSRIVINAETPLINSVAKEKRYVVNILQFLFAVNLWAWLFTVLLCWVSFIAYGKDSWNYFKEGMTAIFSERLWGTLWMWIALLGQAFSTICRTALARQQNMAFATAIMSILSPSLCTIILGIPQLMGPYYKMIGVWNWVSFAIVMIGMILYTIGSLRNKHTDFVKKDSILNKIVGNGK